MRKSVLAIQNEVPNNGWEVDDLVSFYIEKSLQYGKLEKKLKNSAVISIVKSTTNEGLMFRLNGKTIISYANLIPQ